MEPSTKPRKDLAELLKERIDPTIDYLKEYEKITKSLAEIREILLKIRV